MTESDCIQRLRIFEMSILFKGSSSIRGPWFSQVVHGEDLNRGNQEEGLGDSWM